MYEQFLPKVLGAVKNEEIRAEVMDGSVAKTTYCSSRGPTTASSSSRHLMPHSASRGTCAGVSGIGPYI